MMEARKRPFNVPRYDLHGKAVKPMLYLPKEQGQSTTEYALALAGIALVVVGILMLLGPAIGNTFSGVVGNLRALPP